MQQYHCSLIFRVIKNINTVSMRWTLDARGLHINFIELSSNFLSEEWSLIWQKNFMKYRWQSCASVI